MRSQEKTRRPEARGYFTPANFFKTLFYMKERIFWKNDTCRRLPPVTAWYTPSIATDKTQAPRDMLYPYLKTKLIEPLLNNALDKYPPILKLYIYIFIY